MRGLGASLSILITACTPNCHTHPSAGPDAPADSATCGAVPVWDALAQRIDGGGVGNQHPQIGVDAAGNAIAVWEQQSGNTWFVYGNTRSASGTWGTPVQLDATGTTGTLNEPNPALAVSANGTAVAVYQQAVPSTPTMATNVWRVTYAPASGWAAAAQFFPAVQADQVSGNENPRVSLDATGDGMAVWAQDMGDGNLNPDFGLQIYASRLHGGVWSVPVLLSSYASDGFTQTPDVAVDEQGNAVAVWGASPANSPLRARGAQFDEASGAWSAASFIDQCTSCTSSDGIAPRVAFGPGGIAIAVWPQGDSSKLAMYAAIDNDGTWSAAQQIDAGLMTNLDASSPQLAIDDTGIATVVWANISNDASHPNSVIAARYAGGAWSTATAVDTAKPGGNYRPALSLGSDGTVAMVWDSQSNIWATRGGGGAFPAETEIDPEDTAASFPAVAASSCPLAIVVYQADPGGGTGIFSRTLR